MLVMMGMDEKVVWLLSFFDECDIFRFWDSRGERKGPTRDVGRRVVRKSDEDVMGERR